MRFAFLAPFVLPADIQLIAVDLPIWERVVMAHPNFFGDLLQANAAYARRRAGEVFVNDILIQSNRLEDLRTRVTLHGGNTHLREDFDDAFRHGLDVVIDRFVVVYAFQQVGVDHVVHRLEGEIRINRRDSITK